MTAENEGLVNINSATLEDLMTLSGITEERAQNLIDYRNEHGPFKSWDDVRHIPGYSADIVDLMRESGAWMD